jgi:competence protein CoiA
MHNISVIVRVASVDCWSCGAEGELISSLLLSRGVDSLECSVSDLTGYPQLGAEIMESIANKAVTGVLKPRFSGTLQRTYMSNGCAHCDALFGQSYEIHTRCEERDVAAFAPDAGWIWNDVLDALLAAHGGNK